MSPIEANFAVIPQEFEAGNRRGNVDGMHEIEEANEPLDEKKAILHHVCLCGGHEINPDQSVIARKRREARDESLEMVDRLIVPLDARGKRGGSRRML